MSDLIWPALHVDGKLTHARAEWIAGNGAGAYASSTVALMHTRRYHGLLVAALEPPLKRTVVVSHVDTRLQDGAQEIELASHQFRRSRRGKGTATCSGSTRTPCLDGPTVSPGEPSNKLSPWCAAPTPL